MRKMAVVRILKISCSSGKDSDLEAGVQSWVCEAAVSASGGCHHTAADCYR